MKIALQYINDKNGKPQAIQMPLNEWGKILSRLKKSEQALQIKPNLKIALKQVDSLRKSKAKSRP